MTIMVMPGMKENPTNSDSGGNGGEKMVHPPMTPPTKPRAKRKAARRAKRASNMAPGEGRAKLGC